MNSALWPCEVQVMVRDSRIEMAVLLNLVLVPEEVSTFIAELLAALHDLELQDLTLEDRIHEKNSTTYDQASFRAVEVARIAVIRMIPCSQPLILDRERWDEQNMIVDLEAKFGRKFEKNEASNCLFSVSSASIIFEGGLFSNHFRPLNFYQEPGMLKMASIELSLRARVHHTKFGQDRRLKLFKQQ